jgi:hypothetical protein
VKLKRKINLKKKLKIIKIKIYKNTKMIIMPNTTCIARQSLFILPVTHFTSSGPHTPSNPMVDTSPSHNLRVYI